MMGETQTPLDPYRAWDIVARLRDEIETLRRERDEARSKLEKFRRLDAEAARYCEVPISARTKFTGEPPYVGWQGLGLAMIEAFDERDEALALLREAGEVLEPFADACKDTIDCDADKWRDTDDLWESPAAMALCAGDLRRASAVLAKIKEALNVPANP